MCIWFSCGVDWYDRIFSCLVCYIILHTFEPSLGCVCTDNWQPARWGMPHAYFVCINTHRTLHCYITMCNCRGYTHTYSTHTGVLTIHTSMVVLTPHTMQVLVLDHMSTRIMSACCKMQDVMTKGVTRKLYTPHSYVCAHHTHTHTHARTRTHTVVESLDKSRQPLAHMEAVYIMVPSENVCMINLSISCIYILCSLSLTLSQTVTKLIGDFEGTPTYKAAHVFFLESMLDIFTNTPLNTSHFTWFHFQSARLASSQSLGPAKQQEVSTSNCLSSLAVCYALCVLYIHLIVCVSMCVHVCVCIMCLCL